MKLVREVLNKDEMAAWYKAAEPYLHPSRYSCNRKRFERFLQEADEKISVILLPKGGL